MSDIYPDFNGIVKDYDALNNLPKIDGKEIHGDISDNHDYMDTSPTKGSRKLLTSGVVYSALQDASVGAVSSVNGKTGEVKLAVGDLGINVTEKELNYLDGVTSNIQTQLNGKANSSHNHSAANITSGTLSSVRLPTVPIAKGGTGATTEEKARYAMNFIGVNPLYNKIGSTATTADDTVANWISFGYGYAYIGNSDKAIIQSYPVNYASYLHNIVYDSLVYQFLFPLTASGTVYHRAGSVTNGWYGSGEWINELNSATTIPIENGGTGAKTLLDAAKTLGFPSLLQATKLPAGTDLNTILTIDNYKSTSITDTNSMLNCPVKGAGFRMLVYYPVPGLSNYIAQDIYETGGGTRHYRITKDVGKSWTEWTTTYDSNIIKDYIIEAGETGGWKYQKYASGLVKAQGMPLIKTTGGGGTSIGNAFYSSSGTITPPKIFSKISFVNITSAESTILTCSAYEVSTSTIRCGLLGLEQIDDSLPVYCEIIGE